MSLFRSKTEKHLDALLESICMNMANNYKDNAQADFRDFEEALEEAVREGRLSEKSRKYYETRRGEFGEKLKGYSHKDQKPYWTRGEG